VGVMLDLGWNDDLVEGFRIGWDDLAR
jgi:hypothetical protein